MNKELELKKDFLPSTAVLNFEEDAGSGFDNMSSQDVSIPFIDILQKLSPHLGRNSTLVGAREGDILNPVSKEVFPGEKGIKVIPCAYQKKWVEWKSRATGGGFVKHHDTHEILMECKQADKVLYQLPNGNAIVPTAYYYVLVVKDDGSFERGIIPMKSTQIAKSKKWNTIMQNLKVIGKNGPYTPPMFSQVYLLTSTYQEKSTFSWYGWDVSLVGPVTNAAVYVAAKKVNSEFSKGEIKVVPVDSGDAEETGPITSEVM